MTASRRYSGKTADERRAERRLALLGAALDIWQEQGWAAVTMRGVCARANLTDRYFYENFANRDALLATTWEQVRDETLRMVLDAVASRIEQPALDQLRAAVDVVVHHVQEEPARAQILFGDHAGSAVLEQLRRQTVQETTGLLIELARPHLKPDVDDLEFRVNVLLGIGGFVEIMLAWRSGLLDADADTLVDHLTGVGTSLSRMFLKG
ncbi:TetR/AcrR family transcriptional regulator [Amycolatopsis alba]|uniref:TetR/AcrR family transcriptional regulator n=1 Tax=Amycolatopsis alba DSM 44262 TaxID=1125972 RepID=A0A229RJT1_AMYAL|nr:TetR/AcrR family transcriptional regulator [Amycolatopsis alba]OXM46684.1 TetR/AcrR family transcriptional regulator [Amycolatopsis alba DSM 44262]